MFFGSSLLFAFNADNNNDIYDNNIHINVNVNVDIYVLRVLAPACF